MSMPSPSAGGKVSAMLFETEKPANKVTFKFNPQKIAVSHAVKRQEISPQKATDDQANTPQDTGGAESNSLLDFMEKVTGVGATTISLGDLLFDGDGTVKDCAQLLTWSYPPKPEGSEAAHMTKLTLKWGGGPINYSVTVISVDISYERFTPSGKPIRAKATLKLQSLKDLVTGTNPTSGGIPGRRSHTLVSGENLQHIAMANYGRPGAWRALAAANGIEDPLAVQPGTLIYLPAPAELADGGPR